MLVLSRKKDESIFIGSQIEVKITSIQGDRVQVGIVAPREIEVVRSELRTRKYSQSRRCKDGSVR